MACLPCSAKGFREETMEAADSGKGVGDSMSRGTGYCVRFNGARTSQHAAIPHRRHQSVPWPSHVGHKSFLFAFSSITQRLLKAPLRARQQLLPLRPWTPKPSQHRLGVLPSVCPFKFCAARKLYTRSTLIITELLLASTIPCLGKP